MWCVRQIKFRKIQQLITPLLGNVQEPYTEETLRLRTDEKPLRFECRKTLGMTDESVNLCTICHTQEGRASFMEGVYTSNSFARESGIGLMEYR